MQSRRARRTNISPRAASSSLFGSDLLAFLEVHPRACILSKLDRAEQMLGANDRLRVARRSARFALLTLDGPAG